MHLEPPPFPPGYKPDPSLIWVVLGLMAFDFLLILVSILLIALSEERKMNGIERTKLQLKPIRRRLGTHRGEIWLAEDFDALPPEILARFLGEEPAENSAGHPFSSS